MTKHTNEGYHPRAPSDCLASNLMEASSVRMLRGNIMWRGHERLIQVNYNCYKTDTYPGPLGFWHIRIIRDAHFSILPLQSAPRLLLDWHPSQPWAEALRINRKSSFSLFSHSQSPRLSLNGLSRSTLISRSHLESSTMPIHLGRQRMRCQKVGLVPHIAMSTESSPLRHYQRATC